MIEKATFGAGCFWGVEQVFASIAGVVSTAVGYEGGRLSNPCYEDVCTGETEHAEVVELCFDSKKVSYYDLLKAFFSLHDPTTIDQQGPDIGTQYRSIIFYHNEDQRKQAEKAISALDKAGIFRAPIVTIVEEAKTFYKAEEYHQRYLEKNGMHQCATSARDFMTFDWDSSPIKKES